MTMTRRGAMIEASWEAVKGAHEAATAARHEYLATGGGEAREAHRAAQEAMDAALEDYEARLEADRILTIVAGATTKDEFIRRLEEAHITQVSMAIWFAFGDMAD